MPASEKQISEEQVLVVSGNDILNLDLPTVTEAAGRRRLFEESSDVPSDRVKLVYHPSDA